MIPVRQLDRAALPTREFISASSTSLPGGGTLRGHAVDKQHGHRSTTCQVPCYVAAQHTETLYLVGAAIAANTRYSWRAIVGESEASGSTKRVGQRSTHGRSMADDRSFIPYEIDEVDQSITTLDIVLGLHNINVDRPQRVTCCTGPSACFGDVTRRRRAEQARERGRTPG